MEVVYIDDSAAPQARRSTRDAIQAVALYNGCSAGAEIYPDGRPGRSGAHGLLRRRGDLPTEACHESTTFLAAPQTRRSTFAVPAPVNPALGCSAGAEIYLRYNGLIVACHRLLRRCGDLPVADKVDNLPMRAAPQARRSTDRPGSRGSNPVGCSAGAEIYLRQRSPKTRSPWLLRRSGDLPLCRRLAGRHREDCSAGAEIYPPTVDPPSTGFQAAPQARRSTPSTANGT